MELALQIFNPGIAELVRKKKAAGDNIPVLRHAIKSEHAPKRPLIQQVFLCVSMGGRHEKLAEIAWKEGGIDVRQLRPKEFVGFINRERNYMALFGAGGALTFFNKEWMEGGPLLRRVEGVSRNYGGNDLFLNKTLLRFLHAYMGPQRKKENRMQIEGKKLLLPVIDL